MKKGIAFLIAFCLLASILPMGVITAAEADPVLIFDMEVLDGGTNGASLADVESGGRLAATSLVKASAKTDKYIEKEEGVSPAFFVGSRDTGFDSPALYGKEDGANGTTRKYVRFATSRPATEDDETTQDYVTDRRNARLVVPIDKSQDIANQDLIFEAWIRPNKDLADNRGGNHLDYFDVFNIGSARGAYGATSATQIVAFRWFMRYGADGGPRFYPQKDGSSNYFSFYNSKVGEYEQVGYMDKNNEGQATNGNWMHLVITRRWVPTNENVPNVGKWQCRLYIDGVHRGDGAGPEYTKEDYASSTAAATNPFNHLIIGGGTSGVSLTTTAEDGPAFKGDIAEFRLYKGVYSDGKTLDAAVEDMFLASKKPYIEAVTPDFEGGSLVADTDADSISFKFGGEVPSALINSDNIKVQSADGSYTLNTGDISYNAETYEVTIPINDYLEYGKEYCVWFSKKIKDKYDKWLAAYSLPFKSEGFFEGVDFENTAKIEGFAGTVEDSSEISITSEVSGDGAYTLALIVFKNGILDRVVTDTTPDGGNNLNVTTSGIDLASGDEYIIKAIAWKYDETQGAMAVSRQIVLD